MKRSRFIGLLTALLVACGVGTARADTINVAVASNFTATFKRLVPAFEMRSGHDLNASFGATGQLYAQISNGAPFDVFLSADMDTPRRLVDTGKAVPDSVTVYARGRLALWSATPGLVDEAGAVLGGGDYMRIAIANPKTAPYGRAAIEALGAMGLLERTRALFVTGESIAQVQQFIASGNVPLGFIALGQVLALPASERGSYWTVPATLHTPIDQGAVLLTGAKNAAAARAFLAFLASDEARATIAAFGYDVPAAAN